MRCIWNRIDKDSSLRNPSGPEWLPALFVGFFHIYMYLAFGSCCRSVLFIAYLLLGGGPVFLFITYYSYWFLAQLYSW